MDIKFWKYFNCPAHDPQNNAALPRSTALPGIHFVPRAGMQLQVRPGIQLQVEIVETPPGYNPGHLLCGPKAPYILAAFKFLGGHHPLPLSPFPFVFHGQ